MSSAFMQPFPVLRQVCAERWILWEKNLERELGKGTPIDRLQSYLPMWLRKNAQALSIPPFWIELCDYEWSVYWSQFQAQLPKPANGQVMLNPFCRILRHNFDIKGWIENGAHGDPRTKKHIVFVAGKNQIESTFEMAAIVDELGEQPLKRILLVEFLRAKHGDKDWGLVIDELKTAGVIIE
jgi:hypothetical protein